MFLKKRNPGSIVPLARMSTTGDYSFTLEHLQSGRAYEFRARVRHPLIDTYGKEDELRRPVSWKSKAVSAARFAKPNLGRRCQRVDCRPTGYAFSTSVSSEAIETAGRPA